MRYTTLVTLNILTTLLMITVNILANALPINGMNTGQLSALYPNEFVPAGFTFSIWLVIYIFITGACIYQLSGIRDPHKRTSVQHMGLLFALTNILNAGWILAWHYRHVALSVVIMISLLLTLLTIHLRLPIPDSNKTIQNKLWIQSTFSIYLGWIMTATVANITAWLVDLGWNGSPLTQQAWAIIMIIIAGLLALMMLFNRNNTLIALVAAWSIGGIIARQRAANGFNSIAMTGAIACSVLMLAILVKVYQRSATATAK